MEDQIIKISKKVQNNSGNSKNNLFHENQTKDDIKNDILENLSEKLLPESTSSEQDQHDQYQQINPWSLSFIGIPINYFCVGIIYAGSVSILYPILIIKNGVTSSFYTASNNLVTLFWSYKIFFGFCSDCFPIFQYKKKPYIIIGWILCAIVLTALGFMPNVSSVNLVLMLTLANLGYVIADVAADGFVVWIAHASEDLNNRGNIQTLIYTVREFGRIWINVAILFGFSGPETNCPGYEDDENQPCTNDTSVKDRNDLSEDYPDDWCYMQCDAATFDFGLTISQYVWMIACVNIICLPFYFILKEEKSTRDMFSLIVAKFWSTMQRRAVWQVMQYSLVTGITLNITNPAKTNANYVWLNLTNLQNQLLNIFECIIFFIGLALMRKYALNMSWRILIWCGTLLTAFFNLLYLLIVYNVYRNAWFYIVTDVSATFIYTLNFMASSFCIVEVAEPGLEAITYSLITTASNAITPLSSVVSYQFLALFPELNDQERIEKDDDLVRNSYAALLFITTLLNLSSLLALPMLPRQKMEIRALVAKGETSKNWAGFTLCTACIFLVYATFVTFFTVAGEEDYGCYKIFGGEGCTPNESDIPVAFLIGSILLYCYGVNFYLTYWPILNGNESFSWRIFV